LTPINTLRMRRLYDRHVDNFWGLAMINPVELCASVQATQLRATRRVLDAWIAAAERVDQVVLRTARDLYREEIDSAVQMCAARSPSEAAATAQAHGAALSQRLAARNAELLRAFTDAGTVVMKAAQAYADETNVDAAEVAVEDRYIVPNADAKGFDPLAGAMQFWNDAYVNLQKLMQAGVESATDRAGAAKAPKSRDVAAAKSA
jgi:hypothetical protein